jgi:hypothetical protein
MELYELMETIELSIERYINKNMTQIVPARDNIGLDPRAAYTMYISPEAIAVPINQDRTLQYYGGFEYVDTDYRKELGDYVFYLADDDRVAGHIDRYFDRSEEEEDAA